MEPRLLRGIWNGKQLAHEELGGGLVVRQLHGHDAAELLEMQCRLQTEGSGLKGN